MRKLILVLVLLSPLSVVLGSATVIDENTRIIRESFDLESDILFFSQPNFDSKVRSVLNKASGNIIDPDHLVLSSSYLKDKSDDLSIMKYVQKYKGLNIHSSRIIVGIKDGKVVTLKSNYYPEKDIDTEPTLGKEDIIDIIENDTGFQLIRGGSTSENGTTIEDILLEIYPESTSTEIKYHLAYNVELGFNISPPSKWVYIIDANNGEILEKYNKVVFTTLSGHVTGRIYPEHPDQSLVVRNFRNETLYEFTDHLSNQKLGKTGADGFYSLSGLQDSFTLSTGLAGEFVDVINETRVDANHYAIITTPSTHNIDWGTDDTSYKKERSNVFYHINLVHDFFTRGSPFNINAMNYLTHAYVQYPGTCNAFSDGTNIYFSGAGGGCESASLFSDIIYHEYTHNVIDHMYTNHAPVLPYRVESGALNEGLADYFASTINGNPCIAEGLDGDCLRYMNNTYRFPEDVTGQTHKDGIIVSGSSWDMREMLGSDISDSLVINALKLEPFNFSEYLDDIIVADDNNANLEDGTPHLFEICTAFFKNHGIFSSYCSKYYRSQLTVNLLKNPGFESESANWTEYSNGGNLIIKKNPMGTYSGNWLAYMGDYNNVDQYIFQDITIPSGIEKAYVQFWYWIRSKETTEGSTNDIMKMK